MIDLAIFGVGGFGRDLYCLIKKHIKNPDWNIIGFFDDKYETGVDVRFGKVLGGIKELNEWNTPIAVVLALGHPKIMKAVREKITNSFVSFPNVVMPDTFYYDADSFEMGEGNIICGNCSFGCDVKVGSFNVFNGFIALGHDVKIGNYNSMMPKTQISGDVTMGNSNFFGVSSIVLQKVKIGNGISLGAGSFLFKKTKDNTTYIGNPAKAFEY